MSILIGLLTAVHVLVAIFLIVLVLMQKSKDQGVGAAFGGAVTETVFGAGTTSALVRMTIWCAGVLLASSLILAVLHSRARPTSGGSLMEKTLNAAPIAPVAPAGGPAVSQPPVPPVPPAAESPAAPAAPANPPAPATPAAPAQK